MYKVIAANRSSNKAPKNWRIFEQEYMEKHFGKVLSVDGEDGHSVLNAYEQYKDTIEYIRWYPCPETCNEQEYSGILSQDNELDLKYITNSAQGFKSVQSKEVCFETWKDNGVYCPEFFTYDNKDDFYKKLSQSSIQYPFLVRVNNSVSGKGSELVRDESQLDNALTRVEQENKNRIGINRKMMCVQFINTIDKDRNVNVSYRIHVSGDKVISGYGRVVPKDNWLAITAGSFSINQIDNWLYYNELCQKIMVEKEQEIVKSVQSLGLNHQGVDLVIDEDTKELCFLEVQPTYATGYQNGIGSYTPPFYNPYDPQLVNYLVQNKSELEQKIPMYYFNWLDKRNHFDLVFKELKRYVWA